jgi:gliding motility-associated-like protein
MKNFILIFLLSLFIHPYLRSQVVVGNCTSGGATATGGYTDFTDADNNYATGQYDFTTPVVNQTITTYHLVNSGASGSIGFDISHHSANTNTGTTGCISNTHRTAVLYPVGGCAGASISPTLGANNGTYYNPEFKGLTPNTSYILVVTTSAVANCSVDQMWVTYYSINSSCPASVGTVSVSGGTSKGANEYDLTTNGSSITISSTGSVLPSASTVSAGSTSTYGYFVFSQQPTLPFTDVTPAGITSLPGFEGVAPGTSITDNNALGESSSVPGATTLWFIPAVFDKKEGGLTLDDDGDGCFAVGTPIKVNYVVTVTPTPCGTCTTPNCPVTKVPLYSNRNYSANCNTLPSAGITNQTYVTYHTVTTDNNGAVGLVQQVQGSPTGCFSRTAVLKSLTNTCTAPNINPSVSNANNVGSTFNPEWYNLTPNTNYVAVVTTVIPAGCTYYEGCLNSYGIPNPPPPPTCKTVDFEFYSDAGLSTKFSGTSFTCSSSPVYLAPKDVGTVYFGSSSSPDSGWPFPVIVVDITATSGNLNSSNTTINIYDAVTGTLVDSSPIGDGNTSSSVTGSNFHFFAKPGGYTISLDKSNTNSGTYTYTAYDVMSGTVIGTGTLTITSGAESAKSIVLKPTNFNGGFTCATCGTGSLIQGIAPQYLDEIGIGTFDPSKAGVGTHTITYTWDNGLTGAANCKGTKSINVTVTGGPTITPTLSDVCLGSTTTKLTYTSTGTPTKYSIDWNSAANTAGLTDLTDVALGASPVNITIPGNLPAGTYTGSLTAKNASGCSSAAQTVTFKVNAGPTILGTSTLCVGDSKADWKPTTGVTWSTSAAGVATIASGATLTGVSAGTATITATDNTTQCTSTKSVTVNAKPTINGTLTLCEGATTQLTGSGTAAASNPWVSATTSNATVSNSGLVTGVANANGNSIITYTDNNGCVNTATVTVNPKITTTITCGASTTTSVTFNWTAVAGATTYNLTYDKGAGPVTVTGQAATTYQISGMTGGSSASLIVTPVGTGCYKPSTQVSCTADNCPSPTITQNPVDVAKCTGTSTSFTVAATSTSALAYQWQMIVGTNPPTDINNGGVYSGATTPTLQVSDITGLDGIKYQCKVTETTSGTGCNKTSLPALLTVYAIPVITTINDITVCNGAPVSAVNFASTPAGATFTWVNNTTSIGLAASGNGNISSFNAVNSSNVLVSSTVTVSATLNGCVATDKTFLINVNPSLQPTIVCGPPTQTSVTFDWSPGVSGATSYSLAYKVNNGTTTTVPVNATTYTVNGLNQNDVVDVVLTPSGTGCYLAATGTCTAINCTSPTFTSTPSDLAVCEGQPVSLSGNSTDAQSIQWQVKDPISGNWTDITGETNSTISYPTSILLMNGSQYRLKAIEASGNCPAYTNPVTLSVNAVPTMVAITDKEFCPSILVNDPSKALDINFKVNQTGSPTFSWTSDLQTTGVSTGANDVNNFGSFTTTNPTSDQISTITVTPKLNQCVGQSITFKITVKPTIKPIFSSSVIDFSSVKFTWSSSSLLPDTWKIDTAITSNNASQPALNQFKSATPISGATTEFTVNGINSTKKAYINVTPAQDPSNTSLFCPVSDGFSGIPNPCVKPIKPADPSVTPVCEGSALTVTGVSADATADFQWKISTDGGTTWNNVSFSDFGNTSTTNVLSTQASKAYMNNALVKVVLTDKQTGQCTEESNTTTLKVNEFPNVKLIQPTSNSLCVGDKTVSAFVQKVSGAAPLKVDYTLDGVTTTNQDISSLEVVFQTNNEKNFSLSIDKVIDANGCVTDLTGITAAVSVHKNPTPQFAVSDTIGCFPMTIFFTDISVDKYTDVTWDFGTGSNSSKDIGTTSFTYTKEGDYSITYTAVNEFGCEGQIVDIEAIHIKSAPNAVITTDRNTISVYENEVKFDSKLSSNGSYYRWDFGDNTPTSNDDVVKHKYDPTLPGKYKVTLIVSNSSTKMTCSDTATSWIDFPEEVIFYIPNTFTPNGDEFNNTFQPVFYSGYDPQHYSFTIYDRWGQVVFESKNPAVGWDGTYGDIILGNDTFVWKLGFKEKASDDEHHSTGHVNLVR